MNFEFGYAALIQGILVFIRIGGILFCLPVFGDTPTPVRVRIFIALGMTMVFANIIPSSESAATLVQGDAVAWVWAAFKELFIGFVIGMVTRLAFDAILMAANLVGYQMGFGTATLFIPDAEQQLSGFTAMHRVFVMLIFFSLNLHHIFIGAIADSFAIIPIGGTQFNDSIAQQLIQLSAMMFEIGVQLSAPILVALLFTMAALGLMARTVPQLNVFIISFPASFFVGLVIYIATFSFYPEWLQFQFDGTQESITQALLSMAP